MEAGKEVTTKHMLLESSNTEKDEQSKSMKKATDTEKPLSCVRLVTQFRAGARLALGNICMSSRFL